MIVLFFLGILSFVMKHQSHWTIHNPNLEHWQEIFILNLLARSVPNIPHKLYQTKIQN